MQSTDSDQPRVFAAETDPSFCVIILGSHMQTSDPRKRVRSIVASLTWMAEVWLRDPRRLRADPRFVQQNPRIRDLCSIMTY